MTVCSCGPIRDQSMTQHLQYRWRPLFIAGGGVTGAKYAWTLILGSLVWKRLKKSINTLIKIKSIKWWVQMILFGQLSSIFPYHHPYISFMQHLSKISTHVRDRIRSKKKINQAWPVKSKIRMQIFLILHGRKFWFSFVRSLRGTEEWKFLTLRFVY